MAEIAKWQSRQVLPIIRHNMRRLPDGNLNGNKSIQPELIQQNYSLIDRGSTCNEINQYRKQIEKECYKYNRKNLIHAIEVVIQCPSDCPEEQRELFYRECFEYICSTLPMGKRCVFVAEVHLDEKHFSPTGELLSKGHIHIMYVPAVWDLKHEEYEFKLCADQLTKKSLLKAFHPELQEYLTQKGIQATVYYPKSGNGTVIGLSVSQLKDITEKTGIRLESSITTDRLSEILLGNTEKTHWGHAQEWGNYHTWGNQYKSRDRGTVYDR